MIDEFANRTWTYTLPDMYFRVESTGVMGFIQRTLQCTYSILCPLANHSISYWRKRSETIVRSSPSQSEYTSISFCHMSEQTFSKDGSQWDSPVTGKQPACRHSEAIDLTGWHVRSRSSGLSSWWKLRESVWATWHLVLIYAWLKTMEFLSVRSRASEDQQRRHNYAWHV